MGCCGGNDNKLNIPSYVDDCALFAPGAHVGAEEVVAAMAAELGHAQPKTMNLTLARALSYKKRVAERLKQVETDVQTNNSVLAGQDRESDVLALIEERHRLVNHMIDLKVAIQQANGPIQRLILELAEMKSENDFFRRVPTLHGVRQNQYSYDPGQPNTLNYESVLRKAEVDDLVKRNNIRIDKTQERLENHNHVTTITIEDIGLLS
jgi:hypothetical protein